MEILEIAKVKLSERTKPGSDGCVVWTGARSGGYGSLCIKGKTYRAHRLVWMINEGPIPAGFCVMHLCDNPPCVNPNHLKLGTHKENMQDRDAKGRNGYANYTHCVNGHELTPENTVINKTIQRRACRKCRFANSQKRIKSGYYRDYYKKNRERKLKQQREKYAKDKAEKWQKGEG